MATSVGPGSDPVGPADQFEFDFDLNAAFTRAGAFVHALRAGTDTVVKIGFVMLWPERDCPKVVRLNNIRVEPEWRDQQVASWVLIAVFQHAQEQGFDAVVGDMTPENEDHLPALRRLYERFGFRFGVDGDPKSMRLDFDRLPD